MENFIVSARKYRPVTFDTVVGQRAITSTLKNAIKNNHLAQAFLFCGPRGVGKTTCARIMAKTINCQNLTEAIEPCDECESCVSFNKSATLNIFELDAASNNSVDDIRALVEQVRIPPQSGKYKVYIIDEVHMLSTAAFNAFLKTLEEPPAYAKFILATTEKHKILPTILSRCQIYDFKRITVDDAAEHLAYVANNENITADPDALHIIAQKADGAMRDALSIFDQIVSMSGLSISYKDVIDSLNVLDVDYYFRLTDFLLKSDTASTLLMVHEIVDNGFDEHFFINGLAEHMRNLLVCTDNQTIQLLETSASIKEKYAQQASNCTPAFLLKALELLTKCDLDYKTSSNKRLLVELGLLQVCSFSYNGATSEEINVIEVAPLQPLFGNSTKQTNQTAPATVVPINTAPSPVINTVKENSKVQAPIAPVESAPVAKPITAPLPTTGTFSLNKKLAEAREVRQELGQTKEIVLSDDFSQEQLEQAWMTYAESKKEMQMGFYSTLTKYKPEKSESNKILYTLDNVSQEKELENYSKEMMDFIREQLRNHLIALEVKLAVRNEEDKTYLHPKAKFDQMAQKNPALKDLQNTLQLDIDY